MIIMSSDDKRYIDVGSEGIWYSILSTAEVRLVLMKKSINLALDFLHAGLLLVVWLAPYQKYFHPLNAMPFLGALTDSRLQRSRLKNTMWAYTNRKKTTTSKRLIIPDISFETALYHHHWRQRS